MATPKPRIPAPGVIKFTIVASLVIITCNLIIPILSALCPGVLVQKKFFKEIMHLYYMATPYHKNPCTRGHEIYYFGRAFPGHHFFYTVEPHLSGPLVPTQNRPDR